MCAPTESNNLLINTKTIGKTTSGSPLKHTISSSCNDTVASPLAPAIHEMLKHQATPTSAFHVNKGKKSVHFYEPIVSEVRFRPRTDCERREELYYTREEYRMFRESYMQELEDQRGKLSSWIYFAFSVAADFLASLEVEQKSISGQDNSFDSSSNDLVEVDVYI